MQPIAQDEVASANSRWQFSTENDKYYSLLPRKMGQQSLASLHWDSAYCSSYFWLEECPSRHLKTSNFEEKYRPASFQLFDLWLEFSVVWQRTHQDLWNLFRII